MDKRYLTKIELMHVTHDIKEFLVDTLLNKLNDIPIGHLYGQTNIFEFVYICKYFACHIKLNCS